MKPDFAGPVALGMVDEVLGLLSQPLVLEVEGSRQVPPRSR